jgi:hypothetical protein
MKVKWLNNGKPDTEGVYTASVVSRSGKEITQFKGPSPEDVRRQMGECMVPLSLVKAKLSGRWEN